MFPKTITVHAVHKDSSAVYSETLEVTSNFSSQVKMMEKRVPFSRFYWDTYYDEDDFTKKELGYIKASGILD